MISAFCLSHVKDEPWAVVGFACQRLAFIVGWSSFSRPSIPYSLAASEGTSLVEPLVHPVDPHTID